MSWQRLRADENHHRASIAGHLELGFKKVYRNPEKILLKGIFFAGYRAHPSGPALHSRRNSPTCDLDTLLFFFE